MEIETRVEAERGCGYRKPGGIYIMGGGIATACGRLPIPLDICPCCNQGIKPSRAWTWIQPKPLFEKFPCRATQGQSTMIDEFSAGSVKNLDLLHGSCPLNEDRLPERTGLLWVGGKFYARPADFMTEAKKMGISRRLPHVPKDFKVGVDWVLLAHRECIETPRDFGNQEDIDAAAREGGLFDYKPGIFTMFQPTGFEYVVKGDETEEQLEDLVKRGVKPVKVENPGRVVEPADGEDE